MTLISSLQRPKGGGRLASLERLSLSTMTEAPDSTEEFINLQLSVQLRNFSF